MRMIPSRRVILVLLGLIATVSVAACSPHPAGNVALPTGLAATTPAATATGGQAVSQGAATPSTTPGAVGVQNLVVTPSVRDELQAAYVAAMQFPPSDIAGTAPNSVYYAYDSATGTDWAMATFVKSATASSKSGVEMQDGGDTGMFTKASDGAWQMRRASFPTGCGLRHFFPAAVISVWALSTFCPPGHS
jgi:hypothetical protein